MIVNEIIDYHANHLFCVLCEEVDTAIEEAYATGLLRNNEAVHQELHAASIRAVGDTIGNMPADPSIPPATRRTLELELMDRDLPKRIVEDDTVVKLLASDSKQYIDKVLHDWQATLNLAKTVAELSDQVNNVTRASKKVTCNTRRPLSTSFSLLQRRQSWIPLSAFRRKARYWLYSFAE